MCTQSVTRIAYSLSYHIIKILTMKIALFLFQAFTDLYQCHMKYEIFSTLRDIVR